MAMASKIKRDHFYSSEQIKFLAENIRNYTYSELAQVFNARFDTAVTAKAIRQKCERAVGHQQKLSRYTAEQERFLHENISKYDFTELSEKFNSQFGTRVNANAMKRKCNHQLKIKRGYNSSRDGNGKKPIGTLSKSNGYAVVKTDNVKSDRWKSWTMLHRYIYQQYYGPIPKGKNIVFLNNDKTDARPENLYAVDNKIMQIMRANGWFSTEPAITLTAIKWCELFYALRQEAEKERQDDE
jgi:hypothetical protein